MNDTVTMQEEEDAAAVAREVKKQLAPKRGKMSKKYKILLITLSLILIVLLRQGFIFIIIGILPSIVAYYMDVTTERYTFKTIFAANLCGMLPSLEKMLHDGPNAMLHAIMGNASNWVIIYGSAIIGWLLVQLCPMLAQILIQGMHQTKASHITKVQQKIENEWGREVIRFGSPKEIDEEI